MNIPLRIQTAARPICKKFKMQLFAPAKSSVTSSSPRTEETRAMRPFFNIPPLRERSAGAPPHASASTSHAESVRLQILKEHSDIRHQHRALHASPRCARANVCNSVAKSFSHRSADRENRRNERERRCREAKTFGIYGVAFQRQI